MRAEVVELVALTKKTISESRTLLAELDRLFAPR